MRHGVSFMNRHKVLAGLVGLVVSVGWSCNVLASPKCAAFDAHGQCIVWSLSITDLLSDPQRYNGKRVQVIGFISLDQPPLYEEVSDGIYVSHRPVDAIDYKKGLSLRLPVNHPQRSKFNGHLGEVEGIFNADDTGHMGLWSGTISDITSLKKKMAHNQSLKPTNRKTSGMSGQAKRPV
jgi:hypothetical protein